MSIGKLPRKIFLTNRELKTEVIECKKTGVMSNKLGAMFLKMVNKYGTKNNFCNYSYLDEMKGRAIVGLCKNWQSFDTDKYDNAFAYYTQCIHNEFIQELHQNKKHARLRDILLTESGMLGSFTFQNSYNEERETPIVSEEESQQISVEEVLE
jgi:DNA-directed RNA polymerase specialized sigma subunit